MTQDEHEWGRLYNKEEEEARMWKAIISETREKAFKEGFEIGKQQAKMLLAKDMLHNGFDIATISKRTGLTIEQIEKLDEY